MVKHSEMDRFQQTLSILGPEYVDLSVNEASVEA